MSAFDDKNPGLQASAHGKAASKFTNSWDPKTQSVGHKRDNPRAQRAERRKPNAYKVPKELIAQGEKKKQKKKKPVGRDMPDAIKEMKSSIVDYDGNRYEIHAASIERNGRSIISLPHNVKRPRAPLAPNNVPAEVKFVLESLLVGVRRPFISMAERTTAARNSPVFHYLGRCLVTVALQKYLANEKLGTNVYYAGPGNLLPALFSAMRVLCDPDRIWNFFHYTDEPSGYKSDIEYVKYRRLLVDKPSMTVDGSPLPINGPRFIISYLAGGFGSISTLLYSRFQTTTFIDVGLRSPAQMTGSFGNPVAEFSWKCSIAEGLQKIDLLDSTGAHAYMPPFQMRDIAIKPVFTLSIGPKAASILFGVVELYPSSEWIPWPTRDDRPCTGDDGSTVKYYQNSVYMRKYEEHKEKLQNLESMPKEEGKRPETPQLPTRSSPPPPPKTPRPPRTETKGSPEHKVKVEENVTYAPDVTDDMLNEAEGFTRVTPQSSLVDEDAVSFIKRLLNEAHMPRAGFSWADDDESQPLPPVPHGATIDEYGEVCYEGEPPPFEDDGCGMYCTPPDSSEVSDDDGGTRAPASFPGSSASDVDDSCPEIIEPPVTLSGRTYARVTMSSSPKRYRKNGRDDPVIPLSPQSQGVTPQVPKNFLVNQNNKWYITRAFHSWYTKTVDFFTNGPDPAPIVKMATVGTLGFLAVRLRSLPLAISAALIAVLGNIFKTEDPMLRCGGQPVADLDPEQIVYLSTLVGVTIKANVPLTPDNITRVASTFCKTYKERDVSSIMPNVFHEWKRQRNLVSSGPTFQTVCAASTVMAYCLSHFLKKITLRIPRIPLLPLGTLQRNPIATGLLGLTDVHLVDEESKKEVAKNGVILSTLRQAIGNFPLAIVEEIGKTCTAMVLSATIGGGEDYEIFRVLASAHFGFTEFFCNDGRWRPIEGQSFANRVFVSVTPLLMHIGVGFFDTRKAIALHGLYNTLAFLNFFSDIKRSQNVVPTGTFESLFAFTPTKMLTYLMPVLRRRRPYLPPNSKHVIGETNIPFAGAVIPVCTQMLDLPKLRETTEVKKYKGTDLTCREGNGFRLIGPYISTHIPFCFRSCDHNLERALHSRMGGVPKAFCMIDDPEERYKCDVYIYKTFTSAFGIINSAREDTRTHIITHDEWCKRFPLVKGENMFKQWIERPKIRSQYKCFVKKEKSVMDMEESATDVFSESQIMYTHGKYDPRGISVPYEEMRVAAGPWADYLNRYLHMAFCGRIFYNPGNRPIDTTRWVDWATDNVLHDVFPWALAVQGDDSFLIYKNNNGEVMYLSADMSRYDMSIRTAHFMMAWMLIDQWELEPCPVRDIAEEQQEKRVYHTSFGQYIVEGTMASGDFITISFNSIILMLAFASWMNEGAISLQRHMSRLGFWVTYSEVPAHQPLRVDFLQCRLWSCECGRMFGPKPGRIMARFFWTDKTFGKTNKYLRELKTMCIGLWPLASHVPIVNDLLRNLFELLVDIEPAKKRFEGPDEVQAWFDGTSEEESDEAEREMADLYGITDYDIKLLRQRCRSWNFDGRIDNTPHLSDIVRRIARVDLE